MIIFSYSADLFNTFDGTQFLDKGLQTGIVVDHDDEVTTEQTVVRVDIDAAQHQFLVLGDDAGEVVDDADIIVADDTQGDGIL